jgi:hypothetical protein
MPLDGIDHGVADALRIIDAVVLGPKGERWHHGTRDTKGMHCLRSALHYARRESSPVAIVVNKRLVPQEARQ